MQGSVRQRAICSALPAQQVRDAALQALTEADFIIEAVRESEDIKRSVFSRLDQARLVQTTRHHVFSCSTVTFACLCDWSGCASEADEESLQMSEGSSLRL